jgi:hypothetical protein
VNRTLNSPSSELTDGVSVTSTATESGAAAGGAFDDKHARRFERADGLRLHQLNGRLTVALCGMGDPGPAAPIVRGPQSPHSDPEFA